MKIFRKGGISAFYTFSINNCVINQNLNFTKANNSIARLLCGSSSQYSKLQCKISKGKIIKDDNKKYINMLFCKHKFNIDVEL